MKKLTTLILLLLLICACEEKVSDSLSDQAEDSSSGSSTTDTIGDGSQAMRVVSIKDSSFSYLMHREGSLSTACSLVAPDTNFNSDNYSVLDNSLNINCFLDSEELDLNEEGASFQLQVDNNMCEYVEFRPYKYLANLPGKTQRPLYKTICDTTCAEENPNICGEYFYTYDNSALNWQDRFSDIVTEEFNKGRVCLFNHAAQEQDDPDIILPNCDEGTFDIFSYEIDSYAVGSCNFSSRATESDCVAIGVWDGASCDIVARTTENDCVTAGIWTEELTCPLSDASVTVSYNNDLDEEFDCGGNMKSCIAGAGSKLLPEGKSHILIDSNSSYAEYDVNLTPPDELGFRTNRHIANFSRICSDTSTNKTAPSVYNTISFNGAENELIPNSFSYTNVNTDADPLTTEYVVAANHPFSGNVFDEDTVLWATTLPFYSFRCLDQARDVKAQIRVYIRDWDKTFSDSEIYLSRVSDYANEASNLSRMDNDGNGWNNYDDWDDFLKSTSGNVFTNDICNNSDLVVLPNSSMTLGDIENLKTKFPGNKL